MTHWYPTTYLHCRQILIACPCPQSLFCILIHILVYVLVFFLLFWPHVPILLDHHACPLDQHAPLSEALPVLLQDNKHTSQFPP